MLVTGNSDGSLLFFEVPSLELAFTVTGAHEYVSDVAMSAEAELLVSAGSDSVKLWNLQELMNLARNRQ